MSEYLALEARVAALEQRQTLESRLRASVDLDLSALQEKAGVTLSLVQAVAVVQSDHTRRLAQTELALTRVESTLAEHTARFDGLETKFDGLETKVDGLETRFNGLETRFNGLETKVDGLETKVDAVHTGVEAILRRLGDAPGP